MHRSRVRYVAHIQDKAGFYIAMAYVQSEDRGDRVCRNLAIKTILCELMLHNVAAGQLDEVALL